MKTFTEQFHDQIEAFLDRTKMAPTVFGRNAMKDPTFVFRLRKGHSVRTTTMDRVVAYMNAYEGPEDAA